MASVIANMTMSLDGFVAYPDDTVGELFDWYGSGSVAFEDFGGRTSRVSEPSAALLEEEFARVGAFVIGRRLYDLTNGWNGRPPVEAPLVVVTHEPPDDPPPEGVPITFATSIEDAVARARGLAGDRVVSVGGAATARSCLDAGLLDEIVVNLAPLILGTGIPFFAGAQGPVRLGDPEVVEAPGVTHLRFRVRA